MNFFASSFEKILKTLVQLPVIYTASLLLQPLVIWAGWETHEWSLRGGLWAEVLVALILWLISIGAIVQTWRSRLPKMAKLGLTVLQGPGLGLLSFLIGRVLPILLFFSLGMCRITSDSPSGRHSMTIESACFMDCSHTAYANEFIFEREIGGVTMSHGRFCNANPIFTWNQTETEVKWQARGESGLIRL
jgi:hypothetical protein